MYADEALALVKPAIEHGLAYLAMIDICSLLD